MTDLVRHSVTAIDTSAPAAQKTFLGQALAAVAAGYVAQNTRRAYLGDLRTWLEFCGDRGLNPYLAEPIHAAAWRELLLATHAPSTVHRAMASLSAIYVLLRRENPNLGNPFDEHTTARPKGVALRPRPAISGEDAAAMLAACRADSDRFAGVRDEALLSLLWSTGIRRAGAATAQLADWQRLPNGEGVLRVLGKGGKRKDVRLPPDAAACLQAWVELRGPAPGPLFLGARGKALSDQGVYAVVKQRASVGGVDSSKIMPHGFRAGLITRAYEEELPERDIQAAADHARVETTRGYDRGMRGANVARTVGRLPRTSE